MLTQNTLECSVRYRLQIVELYMMYYVQWKIDFAMKKRFSEFLFDRVRISTKFTFLGNESPMELLEFQMWAEQSYNVESYVKL